MVLVCEVLVLVEVVVIVIVVLVLVVVDCGSRRDRSSGDAARW